MRFKKLFFLAVIFILPLAMVAAQTATATLSLSGSVGEQTEITITTNTNASGLDLATSASNLKVGEVSWTSNNPAGFRVEINSPNANGSWVFSGPDGDTLTYQLFIGGTEYTPTSGTVEIANTSDPTGQAGTTQDVEISYDGSEDFLNAGSYSDTLNFSIYSK